MRPTIPNPATAARTTPFASAAHVALVFLAALGTLVPTPASAAYTSPEAEVQGEAYGFVRRVEGDVLLAGIEGDEAVEAEVNHPLLTGDKVSTESGRAELFLPSGSVVRLDRATSVIFDAISGSPDSEDEGVTLLILDQGGLQIRLPDTGAPLGSGTGPGTAATPDDFAVRTPNSTVYLGSPGSYRVSTQGTSFTEVVVRKGFAEADTPTGSAIARNGEALEISGYGRPFVDVVAAGAADGLELWAGDLDRAASHYENQDLDPRLGYAAAPLEDNGEWLVVEKRRAWRPYVRADWRPFRHGRWVYTPSGLTWVASAPWGWVTSHYGVWDYVPGYGWLWLPGNVYMPAGVYWYWGPTHVGWIPSGYYSRYYGSSHFGVYGWAGGDWGYWADWTFCPTRYFGRPAYNRYWRSGRDLGRGRRFAVPRGIVTTDTRGLTPERWGKPNELHETLVRGRDGRRAGRDLPDVTDFVARRASRSETFRALEGERIAVERERLRPLPSETSRGRFDRRTVPSTTTVIRGRAGSRGISSRTRRIEPRSAPQSGSTVRRLAPMAPGAVSRSGEAKAREREAGTRERVRSLLGSRVEDSRRRAGSDRPSSARGSSSSSDSPARRVVEGIRSHRESASGGSSQRSRATSKGPDRPRSSSKSISKNSSGSKDSSRGSSARSSGSSRSGARRASPPSSRRSSGARSARSSRSRPHP